MLTDLLKPVLEWLGVGLIPFLLMLLLVIVIFKD